jgi:hypothetical protein
MSKISPILLGLSLAVTGVSMAAAQQDASSTPAHPKILQITREWVKPYKGGQAHDKTESAFIAAMNRAKFPAYYVALNSMSGRSRALYLTGYNSFDEWEKDNQIVDKNPALSAELERASVADGELLDQVDNSVFTYEEDLSYKPRPDLSHARYLEITVFRVRLGHRKEWRDLAKMVKDIHDKAGDGAHWAMFEALYGVDDGTYIALSSDTSMADIDKGLAEDKKFVEAAGGEEGMKKINELFGAAVESSHSELFAINPKQSYVDETWIKANPDFWKPKAPEAAAVKPAAKPAPTAAAKPAAAAPAKPASR